MLLSFRVSNHRSLRDEQELDLRPVYDRSRPAVPVAAIYGANASGKTNVLDALGFMRDAVMSSFATWDPFQGVPRTSFLFDDTVDDESGFAVDLLVDGVRHSYGFAMDDEQVTEEWLHTYPRSRRRVLFDRDGGQIGFGPHMSRPREAVRQLTRPNTLFLSAAVQAGHEQLTPIRSWFASGLRFADPRNSVEREERALDLLEQRGRFAERILKLVRAADLGISDITVERVGDFRAEWARAALHMQEGLIEQISTERDRLTSAGDVHALSEVERDLRTAQAGLPQVRTETAASLERRGERRVLVWHAGGAGARALPLAAESHGTRSWLGLIGPALQALDEGGVLCVDEIDTSLHPHLTAQLIRLFREAHTNPKRAQLIFNTHDASILGTMLGDDVLGRDEIWFTDKDGSGVTTLYALSDFKPRKGENRERRYLAGSYGAVPFTADYPFEEAVVDMEVASG